MKKIINKLKKRLSKETPNIQELYEASLHELNFKNMQYHHLRSVLVEIDAFTNDNLVKNVIENALIRCDLDININYRKLGK